MEKVEACVLVIEMQRRETNKMHVLLSDVCHEYLATSLLNFVLLFQYPHLTVSNCQGFERRNNSAFAYQKLKFLDG